MSGTTDLEAILSNLLGNQQPPSIPTDPYVLTSKLNTELGKKADEADVLGFAQDTLDALNSKLDTEGDASNTKVKTLGAGSVNTPLYASIASRGLPLENFGIASDGNIDSALANAYAARLVYDSNNPTKKSSPILIPSGQFYATKTLNINAPTTEKSVDHLAIEGRGSGQSLISWRGTSNTFIKYIGGSGESLHSNIRINGILLTNDGGGANTAFNLTAAAFCFFNDVVTVAFDTHWDLTDVLSSKWLNCRSSFGRRGYWARRGTLSYPNALTFFGSHIGSMSEWGMVIDKGSAITINGGSIEGNGLSSYYSSRGGVLLNAPGNEGQVAATIVGVYFEGNSGLAHLAIDHNGASRQAIVKVESSFNLPSQDTKSNYCISAVSGSTDPTLIVDVAGSGFGHFNDYIPDTESPYLWATGQCRFVGVGSGLYQSSLQAPKGNLNSFASCNFDGSLANPVNTIANSVVSNVTSIVKNAVGDFTINFRAKGITPYNVSALYLVSGMLPPIIFSEDTSSIRLTFYNYTNTKTDPLVRLKID
jgi:hypothetical protein